MGGVISNVRPALRACAPINRRFGVAGSAATVLFALASCTSSHVRPAPGTTATTSPPTASVSHPVSPAPDQATSSPPAPVGSATGGPSSLAPNNPSAQVAVTAKAMSVRLPVALSRVVAMPLNGTVVVAGGLNAQQVTTAQTLVFDPSSPSIRVAGQLPIAVHDAGAGVVGGKALVVGGGSAASSNAAQEVHADGSAAIAGHLPQARSDDSVAVAGNVLYVIGGYDGTSELPGVLASTDGATFRPVGQLGDTVRYGAAYASPSAVWVFGGEHQGKTIADIQRVDIATGTSAVVGTLPHPLAHAAVAVISGQVLISRRHRRPQPARRDLRIRPDRRFGQLVGSLPESVSDMATAVVGDTAYIIGGNALTAEQTIAPTTTIVAVKLAPIVAHARR